MEFETLEVVVGDDGRSGRITLARPERLNALSAASMEDLIAAAKWFDDQLAVKLVVVEGKGRAFSAGADLDTIAALRGEDSAAVMAGARRAADLGRRMADALEAMRAVTIAKVHGHCVGGAVVMVAACDLRVASEDAIFSIPEINLGIPLAWGGIPRLVRELGPAFAKELVMTARPFSAKEAHTLGFLNRVVAPDQLDDEITDLVRVLLEKPAIVLEATKRHVNAVTEGMVATARSWADADGLLAAAADQEARSAAEKYVAGLRSGQDR